MRVLVDHGCGRNHGDRAMLNGVVNRLILIDPSISLSIFRDDDTGTNVWNLPSVSSVVGDVPNNLIVKASRYCRRRFFWRMGPFVSRACWKISLRRASSNLNLDRLVY